MSALMSKVCKKYVDDCSCVIPLVAASGIIHEQSGFWTLVIVFVVEVKVSTFLQRYELCCLPSSLDCICLFRLDTSFKVTVRLNPFNRLTVRSKTLILSISHLQIKDCLMVI